MSRQCSSERTARNPDVKQILLETAKCAVGTCASSGGLVAGLAVGGPRAAAPAGEVPPPRGAALPAPDPVPAPRDGCVPDPAAARRDSATRCNTCNTVIAARRRAPMY